MIPPSHSDPLMREIDAYTDPEEREYLVWVQYPAKVFARNEQDAEDQIRQFLQDDYVNTETFEFTAVEKEQQ